MPRYCKWAGTYEGEVSDLEAFRPRLEDVVDCVTDLLKHLVDTKVITPEQALRFARSEAYIDTWSN